MTHATPFSRLADAARKDRIVRELVLFAVFIAAGFAILPAIAWLLGVAMLGAQTESTGTGAVYRAVFAEAAQGRVTAWLFAASPWLFVQSVRLALWPLRRPQSPPSAAPDGRAAE